MYLNADTPFGITASQELSTDPPQYTSFARNKVLFGSWEISHSRYRLFISNLTTLCSYCVFLIFGTGRSQSNFLAVVFSIVIIYLNFLILRKRGFGVAIAFALLLGVNYIFYSYGKLPFLEVTTTALVSIAGFLLLTSRARGLHAFLAGLILAAAAFFAKLLAIVFFPTAVMIIMLGYFQAKNNSFGALKNKLLAFSAGCSVMVIAWLIAVYLPSRSDVSGYLSEISTGMYGSPKAFESPKMFMMQLYSYGFDNKLWSKQLVEFSLGLLGMASVLGLMLSHGKNTLKKLDRVDMFYLLWLGSIFILLFPWNYRPLRYAVLLYPPLIYFAIRWIFLLFDTNTHWGKRKWTYYLVLFVIGSYVVFHLLITPYFETRSSELIMRFIPYGIIGAIIITSLGALIQKVKEKILRKSAKLLLAARILALIILLIAIFIQLRLHIDSSFNNQKTIHNASVDLGKILAADAVIAGPYSSALTQDNRLKSIIKMFGVPIVEKNLFESTPITHLAVEAKGNEKRAFDDYPEIMNDAPMVMTYYLRGFPVNIYLISPTTPNDEARKYQPTRFELSAWKYQLGQMDSAASFLAEFEQALPNTMAAYQLRMKMNIAKGNLDGAKYELNRLLSTDQNNFNLWLMLGDLELKSAPPDLEGALAAFQKASSLNPEEKSVKQQIDHLKKYLR